MAIANTPNSIIPPKPVSAWVWAFRCIRWSTYLAALITLILLLHKTPPPPVQSSPLAAASAEQKLQQVEESASQGQKATLRLDETELNSYLSSHLDFAKNARPLLLRLQMMLNLPTNLENPARPTSNKCAPA